MNDTTQLMIGSLHREKFPSGRVLRIVPYLGRVPYLLYACALLNDGLGHATLSATYIEDSQRLAA